MNLKQALEKLSTLNKTVSINMEVWKHKDTEREVVEFLVNVLPGRDGSACSLYRGKSLEKAVNLAMESESDIYTSATDIENQSLIEEAHQL